MIRALIAIAIILEPSFAFAGHCSGGGHGGGGGGHGGGGGGHSSGGHSAPACEDVTDIVGYRQCVDYGVWSNNLRIPELIVELGTNVRQFATQLHDQGGSVTHGDESFTYRIVMPATARRLDVAVVSNFRIGVGLPHGLYTLIEADLGGLAAPATSNVEMTQTGTFGAPAVTQGTGVVLGGYLVAGIRNATNRGTFALEVAGGARSVLYSFDSAYHECNQTTTLTTSVGVAEARARGELWLGPWFTAGATVGTSMVERNNWMAGLYLGFHTRSFAGQR